MILRQSPLLRRRSTWEVLIATVLAVFPLLFRDPFLLGIIFMVFLWAAAASAWNLSGGYAGQLSLGHSAFFGIGAYTSTQCLLWFNLSPWLGMWLGAFLSVLAALLIGAITIRLRGSFFVMATLAFAAVLHIAAVNWRTVTAGSSGLSIPFHPSAANFIFANKLSYVYVALALLVLYYVIARIVEVSRLGLFLAAYRENDDAARALGVYTVRTRLFIFALSAGLTALCGTFHAQYLLYIDPDSVFGFSFAFQVALISIIGGLGTSAGPVLGSLLITPLAFLIAGTFGGAQSGLYLVIYGAVLVVVLLTAPEGVGPTVARRWRLLT